METQRRNTMIGALIISNTIVLCTAQGLSPMQGLVEARAIINNKVSKRITFSFPDIYSCPHKPVETIMQGIPLGSSFSLRIDLLKGTPSDGSKVCSLSGMMRIQYHAKDKRLVSSLEGVSIPSTKSISGTACTAFPNKRPPESITVISANMI
jgi:hypothetical protein